MGLMIAFIFHIECSRLMIIMYVKVDQVAGAWWTSVIKYFHYYKHSYLQRSM
jgi:hypothetical protein